MRYIMVKHMKKMGMLLIVLTLVLCLMSNVGATNSKQLLFQSEDTSKTDIYVQNTIFGMLFNHTNDMNVCYQAKFGSGIKVITEKQNDYYLYPVFIDETVRYVYRVYYDNTGYTGVISELFADEFNEVARKKLSAPVLMVSNDNLLLVNQEQVENWDSDKVEKKKYSSENIKKQLSMLKRQSLKDVRVELDVNKKLPKLESRAYYQLAIDYKDKQGSTPWCAGHVGANIIRYMTGNGYVYASTIAQFGSVSSSSGIARSIIKNYARAFAGITVKEYNGTANLTYSVVEGQLRLNQPIYSANHSSNNSSRRHALVVHGINGSSVKVRNPWYTYSETYQLTNYSYISGNGEKWIQDGYMSFNK